MTSPQRQPLLHDLTVTLAAPTVVLSAPDGNLDAATPGAGVQGLFHADVRAVSLLRVTLRPVGTPSGEHAGKASLAVGGAGVADGGGAGTGAADRNSTGTGVADGDSTGTGAADGDSTGWLPVVAVMTAADGPGRSRFVGLAQALGDAVPDPTVRVDRRRILNPGLLTEQLTVHSTATAPVRLAVRVEIAGDLTPLEHAKAGLTARSPLTPVGELSSGSGGLSWSDGTVAVAVSAPGATPDAERSTLTWTLTVEPGESVDLHLAVEITEPDAVVTAADPRPTWQRPDVAADDRRLPALVAQSLDDLYSLRMATAASPGDTFLAAGIPWFFTLFGRDSLWAARMLLPLGTDLALGTLRTLAARQGTRTDPASEEEPGKILHEVRRGVFDDGMGLRLPPVYYGTVDATPLWICLLHDAWRWGLPVEDVEPLLPALKTALGWIDTAARAEGGFLKYIDHRGTGLANQGWKDSADAVRFADGRLAEAPLALAEVQGYAYEAALAGAALLDAFGLPDGEHWRTFASDLADRFRARFWVADQQGPYPAMALDASGRPVDAVASNMGHLLATGILNADESAAVAARLAAPDMSDAYGLRTMSSRSGGYGPLRYHCGTVWPHDTAIAVTGLARSGHSDAAARLIEGVLAAAPAFDYRLPELWGGDARTDTPAPVPYPAACRPQAWSAAAAIALMTAMTGLDPDVPAGRLRLRPTGPLPVGALGVAGLTVAGERLDIAIGSGGRVESVTAPAGLVVEEQAALRA
ncbi:glycogen debranching N-terminal domain-containing protein [Streptomyces europaeiscabiei]|uniref:Glycogen debranching N-terminal domain-containing protein n=1 Tax=Streptomyces europaeiscabiei TaxID=146819 RepID=A0AAJ2PP31_9ACTN|nr:glycogen debranching N-terminal domain-containing protein [Streptomyces europaeiscabiei]MDX3130778.1 glycogen debranching N-terminal domain-containing protein [Streptomyces europaeiscabiei]